MTADLLTHSPNTKTTMHLIQFQRIIEEDKESIMDTYM